MAGRRERPRCRPRTKLPYCKASAALYLPQMSWRWARCHLWTWSLEFLCSRITRRRERESVCCEKHRLGKIYFNLPNARAGLLTFSDWYFPRNSMKSLRNSITEAHLTDGDYTQQDCRSEKSEQICEKLKSTQTSERVEGLDRQTRRITEHNSRRRSKHASSSLQRFSDRCYLLKKSYREKRKAFPEGRRGFKAINGICCVWSSAFGRMTTENPKQTLALSALLLKHNLCIKKNKQLF